MKPQMQTVRPVLRTLPNELVGENIIVRPYRAGYGESLFAAVEESRKHIEPWLPWGDKHKSAEDSEEFVRKAAAHWDLREDLPVGLWHRETGAYLGGSGLHRIDWEVPAFEIGYWLRKSAEGRGYMTEAVRLLCGVAFETLSAERVEIRSATGNLRSAAVPKRLGFVLEGTLRSSKRVTNGE